MADPTEFDPALELDAETLAELERRQRAGRPTLDEEITRKYDPARLAKMVVRDAGRGDKLDLATRSDMERLLPGHDFSSVRIFRGSFAEEITSRHKADAVTIANTGMILMRQTARTAPGTAAGQAILAHELTHVAQAQKGMHFAKEGGGDGEHEHEAEAVEAQVAHGHGGHSDSNDTTAALEKDQVRKDTIRARVIELIEEENRLHRERDGLDWSE